MTGSPPSATERRRLRVFTRLGLLDTPPEPMLDEFVRLATRRCGALAGALTLVADDRAWSMAATFESVTTPRDGSFAARAVAAKDGWAEAEIHARSPFAGSAPVAGRLLPLSAAACVVTAPTGERLGALEMVFDDPPDPGERGALRDFAAHVGHLLSLRAEAREYARFVQLSPDPVVTLDVDGAILQANPAMHRMVGLPGAEAADHPPSLVGTTFLELVARGDRARVAAALARVLFAGSRPTQIDLGVRRADGTVLACTVSAAHLDGVHRHLQLVVHDLSEHHRGEEERSRLSEQLARAQRFDALGQIAGGLAHDLNNLLAVMVSNLSLAQEGLTELTATSPPGSLDAIRADLAELALAVDRAGGLTSGLLDFARRTDGEAAVARVDEVVAAVQGLTGRSLGADVVLTVAVEPGLAPVAADPVKLERALVNLVMNARDAVSGRGTVRIGAHHEGRGHGGWVVVDVADDGSGMDATVRARAFEPLFTTKSDSGSGLGLATVADLVDECGGAVRLDSAPGAGTRVTLRLPTADRAALPIPVGPDVPVAGARILLVDAGERTRRVIAQMLQGVGYRVHPVRAAGEAAAALRKTRWELLVAELALGDGSGAELIHAARVEHPDLAVLALASANAPETLDGIPVLVKPFSHTRLLRSVEAVLRAR